MKLAVLTLAGLIALTACKSNKKYDSLKSENEILQASVNSLTTKLASANTTIADLEVQLAAKDQLIAQFQSQVESLESTVKRLNLENASLLAQIDTLQNEKATLLERVAALELIKIDLELENDYLISQINSLSSTVSQLQNQIVSQTAIITALTNELDASVSLNELGALVSIVGLDLDASLGKEAALSAFANKLNEIINTNTLKDQQMEDMIAMLYDLIGPAATTTFLEASLDPGFIYENNIFFKDMVKRILAKNLANEQAALAVLQSSSWNLGGGRRFSAYESFNRISDGYMVIQYDALGIKTFYAIPAENFIGKTTSEVTAIFNAIIAGDLTTYDVISLGFSPSTSRSLFSKESDVDFDLESRLAEIELKKFDSVANSLVNQYGFSHERAGKVSRLFANWSSLTKSRATTEADALAFSKDLLGFPISEIRPAVEATLTGDQGLLNDLINKAATKNGVSAKNIRSLLSVMNN